MNRPAAIILSVAGYSLAETILLLSLIAPNQYYSPLAWQGSIAFGQLILIPGMAAVMSWAINGSHLWLQRTSRILLGGLLAIPVAVAFMLGLFLLLLPLAWSYDVSRVFFAILLPIEIFALAYGSLFLIRKSGRWGVRAEADKWLSERQNNTNPRDRSRRRAVKFAVCIPLLIVLPIFLFLPETLGLVSHVQRSQLGNLSGYRLTLPLTWMVQYQSVDRSGGRSFVSGIAGRGIARGVNPFRWDSLSSWTFGTEAYSPSEGDAPRFLPKEYKVIRQRNFSIGNEQITCIDYTPSYDYWPNPDPDPAIAHVNCSGPGRFYARIEGDRADLAGFYEILSNMTPDPGRAPTP